MPTPLIYPVSQNALQKTLDASLLTGVTASATLNNVTSIQNLKGLMVIDRLDGNNNLSPDKREYISFAGTSGSTVITLVRGLGGSTDQDHAVGAIVEFVNDVVQQQAIIDGLLLTVTTAGVLNRATGANINTGTDDVTIVTPKAIADSDISTGWTSARETWAYASASTITVPSGAAAKYAVGDRIRWKQGAGYKYGVLVAVADTLLTIAVNTDFTVATPTAITDNYYSHQESPIGYPSYFAWTPVITSGTGTPTTVTPTVKYSINGHLASIFGKLIITDKGTASGNMFVTYPITTVTNITGSSSESAVTGSGGLLVAAAGGASLILNKYDGTTWWVNGYTVNFGLSCLF